MDQKNVSANTVTLLYIEIMDNTVYESILMQRVKGYREGQTSVSSPMDVQNHLHKAWSENTDGNNRWGTTGD